MGFPNLKNKHDGDSMVSPGELITYRRKTGRYPEFEPPAGVILCYQKSVMEYVLKSRRTTKVEGFLSEMCEMCLLGETANKIAVVGRFGVGAPAAVLLLEELIAFGTKSFVSIGTAGTLQENIKVGDLVVCERAIRDEGTSHHYSKHSKYAYASKGMTREIIKSLEKSDQKYSVGTSWTIDAPFRETVMEARQYRKEGVATVDMEASALFAVAEYRNVHIGAIFAVSDSLAGLEWKPEFHRRKTRKGLETLYKVALDVLLSH